MNTSEFHKKKKLRNHWIDIYEFLLFGKEKLTANLNLSYSSASLREFV